MANFVFVVDSDAQRRTTFADTVRPLTALMDGLAAGEQSSGPFHILWSASRRAPISQHSSEAGAAVLFGRALEVGEDQPVTAMAMAARWASVPSAVPAAWDGYFAGISFDAARGIVMGGDILGLFPLYWWSSHGVVLGGSSPELFRHHPLFRGRLDILGLTGILLVTHTVDCRTLLEGVRRLPAGALLHVPHGGQPQELQQYELPDSEAYYDLPLMEHLCILEETLDATVRRQLPPDKPHGMLLSGGLDSRLLAGFMGRQPKPTTALTFGHPADFDARFARDVARTLGFTHRCGQINLDQPETCARRHVQWCHLASGFSSIAYWNARPYLEALPAYFISGYVFDATMGPGYLGRSYSPRNRTLSFDNYKEHVLAWGVGVDRLRALGRSDLFQDAIDEILETLQRTYEGYSDRESQRHWMFSLTFRQRFHVGQMPWMYSFFSWPVLPVLDQTLLEVIAGMPPATIGERHAHRELVRTRFPAIARLPLDRNSANWMPLSPSWKDLFRQRLEFRTAALAQRVPLLRRNRHFYHRVYDFDGPGWTAVRRLAEPHRHYLDRLFHAEPLREYWPTPDTPVPMTDPFAEGAGRKLLLGLTLWAHTHPDALDLDAARAQHGALDGEVVRA